MAHDWRKGIAASVLALAAGTGLAAEAAAQTGGDTATASPTDVTEDQIELAQTRASRTARLAEAMREQVESEQALATHVRRLKGVEAQRDAEEAARAERIRAQRPGIWDGFFRGSNVGPPILCRAESASQSAALDRAPLSLNEVLRDVNYCYSSLVERADPYLSRRYAYSGVSSLGALGGAIGGQAVAESTAAAWGGIALLPILVEGTLDRPEFDALDRVSARGLNWVNGRAVQMDALHQRLFAQQAVLGRHVEVLRQRLEKGDQERLNQVIRAGGDDGNASKSVAASAAQRFSNALDDLLAHADRTREATADTGRYIQDVLPVWTSERFQHVLDNYGDKRRLMMQRPQSAVRSIIALPISTLANFIRGSDESRIREQDYFADLASADLRSLAARMSLPTIPDVPRVEPTPIDLAEFSDDEDRSLVVSLRNDAAALAVAVNDALELLRHAKTVNETDVPDFTVPGATRTQNEAASTEQQQVPPGAGDKKE
ncbi:MAG TPA: hypothetical protein DHW63_12460 [Hyphomonadaceae bacterium]|nr:hypothetical protein [Hyphomonadaceae bacterium]